MDETMRVVIADDEPLARDRLRVLLKAQSPPIAIVGEAEQAEQVFQLFGQAPVDTLLLDISMPGTNGLDIARQLRCHYTGLAIIFCTAYDAHALSAFDVQAIDYLMKPIRGDRLAAALARARTFLTGVKATDRSWQPFAKSHLWARLGGCVRLIPLDDVHYLQAEEKYVIVYHAHGQDLIEQSLKSLETAFPKRWIRIHRNCLVARQNIVELRRLGKKVVVVLRHVDQPLEVSRRCFAALREQLGVIAI